MPLKPQQWTLTDKIDLFECMVDVWIFGPATATILKAESSPPPSVWSHSAYGVVTILFSYFEMTGTSLNTNLGDRPAGEDFNFGFCNVYPQFAPHNGIFSDKLPHPPGTPQGVPQPSNPDIQTAREFRDRIRNGIYHLGYTKSGVWVHDEDPNDLEVRVVPAISGAGGTTQQYRLNPHMMARTIVNHFPGFITTLRTPTNSHNHQKFESFFNEFISS